MRKLDARPAAPAPSPAPTRGADEVARVRKKLAAQPMDAAKLSATRQTLGATGAREESSARGSSFAQPPPVQSRLAQPAREAPDLESEVPLCGNVRDASGRPVVGAQVALTDLGRTAPTDASGRFCMRAPHGERTLSVMAVGYRESRQVVRVAGAESEVSVTLAPVAVLDPRDEYASLPDTLRGMVREARRLEAAAAARGSAAQFDRAAGAWERVLARVAGGPLEVETRRHVAETRFRAWEAGPNAGRAQAAIQALTAYVTRAPAGPGRDQAIRWLDRVRL